MIDSSTFSTLTAKFVTLGCKLNFAETSTIAAALEEKGMRRATTGDIPDVVVVNTCSVTAVSDSKCRHAIRSMSRRWPHAIIVVTGCYAQLKPEEVAQLPGVHLVVGNDRKSSLPRLLEEWIKNRRDLIEVKKAKDMTVFEPSCSRGDRTRYFLKVQDGCNYYCSYCTIPFARGRSRSPEIDMLAAQARAAADEGAKEIVLTGVNIGDFGYGTDKSLIHLLQVLDRTDGIERFRISSIEPNLLTEEIIKFTASSEKFMPHFHIPLQCGDDEMLSLMRRRYDTALFKSRIETIRKYIPDAFIGIDLIVGMRGETPERFKRSRHFVELLDVSHIHVFPYSERPGTKALEISPAVDAHQQRERMKIMTRMSNEKELDFAHRFTGNIRKVLFERTDPETGFMKGHTDNYLTVIADTHGADLSNKVAEVKLAEPILSETDGIIINGQLKHV